MTTESNETISLILLHTKDTNDFLFYGSMLKYKKIIAGITEDIKFLKLCLKHKVTPVSHKVIFKSSIEKVRNINKRLKGI
jgi:hypothetical protein